ncbi:MAG: diguanylate cyclase domain-containing protein [Brucella sp.]|nr:diguanylate cyclase [Brucella tritici]
MIWSRLRKKLPAAFLLLMMLAQFSTASAGAAASSDIRSSCWASASLSEDVVTIAREEERWSCGERKFSIDAERVLLRFDIASDKLPPRYLLSRRSALEAIHLLATDRDGAVRQTVVPAADLSSSVAGGYFKASLTDVTHETASVIVAFDMPSHRMTLERAYLAPTDAVDGMGNPRFLLILAGLAGMLVMPLIFNAAFYRALREPFVLWHSALTFSLLMTILVSSGVSVVLFDPPAMTLSWMTTLIFGITVASGAMFTYSFIEPGMMHPLLRRLLPYCAIWAIFLSVFHAAFPYVARPIQASAYTAAFAPILAIFMLSMIDALRRGSRAARFQAVGYTPIILVGLIRLVTGVLPGLHSTDAMLLFFIGCVCEVLFTTLGVADRFVTMKRERDRARDEAELLERLSETDPLTGLLNRRAIERQFEQLQSEGFAAMAVIDIDYFKTINDLNGHGVGDEVLKAVASALQAGPTVRAYRLGGEEFVLLLRGADANIQAELRRQAIPAIVAHTILGIERPVTASMGITEIGDGEDFATLYDRADKLLYEAKSAGRNQTRSEIKPKPSLKALAGDSAIIA